MPDLARPDWRTRPGLGEVEDLFDGVRIPNIIVAADGSVLAFGKSGNLLRRSTDNGRTWSEIQQVGQPHYFKYGRKPSYGINAGLVRLPLETTDGRDVLLFCMPDTNGGGRERMTIWASFDRGET
jgi:hypothetical protein